MTNNELFNAVDDVCEMLYDSYGYNLTAKKYIGRCMNKPCLGIVFVVSHAEAVKNGLVKED